MLYVVHVRGWDTHTEIARTVACIVEKRIIPEGIVQRPFAVVVVTVVTLFVTALKLFATIAVRTFT